MKSGGEFRTTVNKRPGRPVRVITGDFFVTPPSKAQAAIVAKKNNGGKPRSWQAVADEVGDEIGETFSGALMYRIAKGEIASDKVEQALGIKPKTAPAPVCPDCNEVHVVGWCVKVAGEPVKPKPPYNRKRPARPRASISTESAESAAGTILKKTSSEFRQDLVRLLSE